MTANNNRLVFGVLDALTRSKQCRATQIEGSIVILLTGSIGGSGLMDGILQGSLQLRVEPISQSIARKPGDVGGDEGAATLKVSNGCVKT